MTEVKKKKQENAGAIWRAPENEKGLIGQGIIDGKRYVLFTNSFKKEAKHPDIFVYPARETPDTKTTTTVVNSDPFGSK